MRLHPRRKHSRPQCQHQRHSPYAFIYIENDAAGICTTEIRVLMLSPCITVMKLIGRFFHAFRQQGAGICHSHLYNNMPCMPQNMGAASSQRRKGTDRQRDRVRVWESKWESVEWGISTIYSRTTCDLVAVYHSSGGKWSETKRETAFIIGKCNQIIISPATFVD